MRGLVVLVVVCGACDASVPYTCSTAAQCERGGAAGTCEDTHFCSFDDTSCATGRRYDDSAGEGLGGLCFGAFDEDGDGLLDDQDPCPFTGNNDDSDGDGVGDACDPLAANDGDQIVLFEGFSDGLPDWKRTGMWTVDMGDAEVATSASPDEARLVLPVTSGVSSSGRETIRARVGLTTSPLDTGVIRIGDPLDDGGHGIVCELSAGQLSLVELDTDTRTDAALASGIAGGVSFMLTRTHTAAGAKYRCEVRPDGGGTETDVEQNVVPPSSRQLAIATSRADIYLEWVMVVRAP